MATRSTGIASASAMPDMVKLARSTSARVWMMRAGKLYKICVYLRDEEHPKI